MIQRVRDFLLARVLESEKTVRDFQALCGVEGTRGARFRPLHYLFLLGASFGDEWFLTVFVPAIYCELCGCATPNLPGYYDIYICRRMTVFFATVYYLGQSLKDLLQLPRPRPSRVQVLETHYLAEYGASQRSQAHFAPR
jgi:hypothetical protein